MRPTTYPAPRSDPGNPRSERSNELKPGLDPRQDLGRRQLEVFEV